MLNYEDILLSILCLPVTFLWKSLYTTYRTLNQQYKDEEIFHKQHNCVVMYSKSCIRGWPPDYLLKIDKNNVHFFLDPYLNFINTSRCNLDIAMMKISMNPLLNALQNAAKRGVKIRLVVDFLSVKGVKNLYINLLKSGVKVAFYIDKSEEKNIIMHCKYMVKDYGSEAGYLCMGSLNFTSLDTILNNYEDVTFTSNFSVVGEFHKSFTNTWNLINEDNKNLYNKTVLAEHGLI